MNKYKIRFNKTRGQQGRGTVDHVWRVFENDKVVVVLNLSNKAQVGDLALNGQASNYKELFSGKIFNNIKHIELPAWGYQVFVKMNEAINR
jgi:hypothetical protein